MKFKKFNTGEVEDLKDAGYNAFTGVSWFRLYTDGDYLYEVDGYGLAYRVGRAIIMDARDPFFETVKAIEGTEWGGR